jgi:hypothetical protein
MQSRKIRTPSFSKTWSSDFTSALLLKPPSLAAIISEYQRRGRRWEHSYFPAGFAISSLTV